MNAADVLRRASEVMDDRDVVAAIDLAAGDEVLAAEAMYALTARIGYGMADPRRYLGWWQNSRTHEEIVYELGRAADMAGAGEVR